MKALKGWITSAAPVWLALTVAACGDSDPASPGDGSDFDPQAVEQSLEGVYAGLDDDSDVLVGIDLAAQTLGGSSAAAVLAGDDLAAPRLSPSVRTARVLLSSSAAGEVLPAEVLGKTFVWNPESGAYEIDEALTGAPANGVRFILYAVDPITRHPAEPLNAVGHLDLIDESGTSFVRLVVQAVIGEATLVDYFVQGTVTASPGSATLAADAEGFVSDGTHRVDFDFSQTAGIDDATQVATFTVDYSIQGSPGDVSVALTGTVVLDMETGSLVSAEFSLGITAGGDTVVLALEATSTAVSGQFTHNGVGVVTVAGTLENPTFTRADGTELPAEDLQALEALSELVEEITDFVDQLLAPLGELSAA